jgi:cell division protein FtsI/penicillin-binding protein 2
MVEVVMDNGGKKGSDQANAACQDQFDWIEEEEEEPNSKQATLD